MNKQWLMFFVGITMVITISSCKIEYISSPYGPTAKTPRSRMVVYGKYKFYYLFGMLNLNKYGTVRVPEGVEWHVRAKTNFSDVLITLFTGTIIQPRTIIVFVPGDKYYEKDRRYRAVTRKQNSSQETTPQDTLNSNTSPSQSPQQSNSPSEQPTQNNQKPKIKMPWKRGN